MTNRDLFRQGPWEILVMLVTLWLLSHVVWWLWNTPQCWNCDSWHQCLFLRLTQCNPKHWCILPFCHVYIVQTRSNLLDRIPSYNMDQFGQLISTIIVKSWPRKSEQSKDDIDETLHHMLTWPDIKHVFNFSGMSVCMPVFLCWEGKEYINFFCCWGEEWNKTQSIQPVDGGERVSRGSQYSSCANSLQLLQNFYWTCRSRICRT